MSLLIEPLSQMPQWAFLLLVNVLLIVCGMFMDDYASTVILAPIIAPIAWSIGINPLHIGLVFCINLVVGLATPPFGVTLFVTSPIAGVRIEETAKEALPFLFDDDSHTAARDLCSRYRSVAAGIDGLPLIVVS